MAWALYIVNTKMRGFPIPAGSGLPGRFRYLCRHWNFERSWFNLSKPFHKIGRPHDQIPCFFKGKLIGSICVYIACCSKASLVFVFDYLWLFWMSLKMPKIVKLIKQMQWWFTIWYYLHIWIYIYIYTIFWWIYVIISIGTHNPHF